MRSFQFVSQYISLRTTLRNNADLKKIIIILFFFFASVKGGGDYLLNTGFPM